MPIDKRKRATNVIMSVMVVISLVVIVIGIVSQPSSGKPVPLTLVPGSYMEWTRYGGADGSNGTQVTFRITVLHVDGDNITARVNATYWTSPTNYMEYTANLTRSSFLCGPNTVGFSGAPPSSIKTLDTAFGPRECKVFKLHFTGNDSYGIWVGRSNGVYYRVEYHVSGCEYLGEDHVWVVSGGNIPEL